MLKKVIFACFAWAAFTLAEPLPESTPAASASIFVQDPAVFHQRQADLQRLIASDGKKNKALEALLKDANRIAKMNDQCASISINDVMGEECWAFYRVELPAFEERYMRVTGEVRMGHMEMARGLEDRKLQINACVDALYSFAQSKDQFLNLQGGVYLEPLSEGFQANYDFTLQYEPNHREHAFDIAKQWGTTCRDMVVRQDGVGFAPFFLDRLRSLNAELAQNGSLAVYRTDTTSAGSPTIYMDISKPVRSAYYLNGVKLFHSRIASGPLAESNLRIHFEKDGVRVDGEPVVMKNWKPQQFKGSVEYGEKADAMNGRWIWESNVNNWGVDFGPDYDEDSLAVVKDSIAREKRRADSLIAVQKQVDDSLMAVQQRVADSIAQVERQLAEIREKQRVADSLEAERKRVEESVRLAFEKYMALHFSPWIALSGGVATFSDKHYKAFGLDKNAVIKLVDLAAAARVFKRFGDRGEGFFAVGAGAFIGAGISDELERLYVAPLVQFELGFKTFGFRETAIIAIPEDNSKEWRQFRSGLFYSFGLFGVELGHDLVSNLGQGGYLSVFFEM